MSTPTLELARLSSMSMISSTLPTCATSVTSKTTTTGFRHLRLLFALCLMAVVTAGCSKDEPTKDEPPGNMTKLRWTIARCLPLPPKIWRRCEN
jgi:hypothetical protein